MTQTDPVVATVLASGDPGRPVNAATILKAFDHQRRRIAMHYAAVEGIGIGYGELEIDRAAISNLPSHAQVTVSAMVVGSRRQAHEVEFVAVASHAQLGIVRSTVLVRARGWTQTPGADPLNREMLETSGSAK